jgi:hypothetical protein
VARGRRLLVDCGAPDRIDTPRLEASGVRAVARTAAGVQLILPGEAQPTAKALARLR